MAQPRVSVVVPTRARPSSLARCLEALRAQTIAHEIEIVVVQDGRELDVSSVAQAAGARLLVQDAAGPGTARNRGAADARSPFLCFTDDDCEPAPDWAERLTLALENGAPAVLGQTLNASRADRLGAASQLVVNQLAAYARARGRPFGPSSNFACRRVVFLDVPFDAAYSFAGGDRDWCARMLRAGHRLAWEPAAKVLHHQRLTPARFWRQQVAWGRGSYRFRRRVRLRPEGLGFYTGLLLRARAEGPITLALVLLSQVATAWGYVEQAVSELDGHGLAAPTAP